MGFQSSSSVMIGQLFPIILDLSEISSSISVLTFEIISGRYFLNFSSMSSSFTQTFSSFTYTRSYITQTFFAVISLFVFSVRRGSIASMGQFLTDSQSPRREGSESDLSCWILIFIVLRPEEVRMLKSWASWRVIRSPSQSRQDISKESAGSLKDSAMAFLSSSMVWVFLRLIRCIFLSKVALKIIFSINVYMPSYSLNILQMTHPIDSDPIGSQTIISGNFLKFSQQPYRYK